MIGEKVMMEGFVSEYRYVEDDGAYNNILYPVTGFFVMPEDEPFNMKLYDSIGRFLHPMHRVSIARTVANTLEGDIRFPRPFIFRYKNNEEKQLGQFPSILVSQGDFLKISYIGGSIFKPLVECSIESFAFQNQTDFIRTDPTNLERRAKRYENNDYYLEFENKGNGEINLKIAGKGNRESKLNLEIKDITVKLSKLKINEDKITIDENNNIGIEGTEVKINDGTKGGARIDDTIEATIPAGTFLIKSNPSTDVLNPTPITISGKITGGSGTIKLGD